MIKVIEEFKFHLFVRPACLHQNSREILKGQSAIAIGFGALGHGADNSDVLMKVKLTVVPPKDCKGLLEESKSQICVKGERSESGETGDTCGGKFILNEIL